MSKPGMRGGGRFFRFRLRRTHAVKLAKGDQKAGVFNADYQRDRCL